jgi:hypothetical protein
MNNVIAKKMTDLVNMGVLTGDETDQEIANLAGQVSKFSVFDVLANTLDKLGDIVSAAMDALGALAAAAALIAVIKNADILGKLKGFGAAIASLPNLAFDTVDTADVDAGVDDIIGSARIPSIADVGEAVSGTASSIPNPSIDPGEYFNV